MKRLLILVALLAPLFNPLTAHAIHPHRCGFQGLDRARWTTEEVRRTITCMARKFGVDPQTALAVAYRESRFDETARNWSGCGGYGCLGLFQHHRLYWRARADAWPDWQRRLKIRTDAWSNPRINAYVTARMVQSSGWAAW